MKTTRSYVMTARAQATAATNARILAATVSLAEERASLDLPLADIATRAGVSVQTVLRHFANREALVDAAVSFAVEQVQTERAAPAGDVAAAVRVVVDHYESRGRAVLGFLAQEASDPRLRAVTDRGRAVHRTWVRNVFAPIDEAQTDLLVIATDVYAWKLLRLDRGRSRKQTEARMRQLVTAILRLHQP